MVLDGMDDAVDALLNFAKMHKTIYIYGAGNYGMLYAKILKHFGIKPYGFIVTEAISQEGGDYQVYSICDAIHIVTSNDGVIPAFTNSESLKIKNLFKNSSPDVLDFDHKRMLCLADELFFFPIKDELDKQYVCQTKKTASFELNRILVIRIDAIGDLIFISAFIRELKRNFPESTIDIVVRDSNYSLIENCPYVDNIYPYRTGLIDGELSQQCEHYDDIRDKVERFTKENFSEKQYDAVFLPRELLCGRNMLDDLLLAYYSGAKYRFGQMVVNDIHEQYLFDRMQNSFTLVAVNDKPCHQVQCSLKVLYDMGLEVKDEKMELWPSEEDIRKAKEAVNTYGDDKLIALGIMATAPKRVWDTINYIELINEITRTTDGCRFVIFGGNDAVTMAGSIMDQINNKERVLNLTNKLSLRDTAAYISLCDLYVGSNTGLLHFASAMNVPSVTIYSELEDGQPMDGDAPERMGAWCVPHVDLIPPAGLDGCHGVCRKHYSHCVNQITPRQVYSAIRSLMSV